MSQSTITVSDGENFFRIPLSDLPEAAADGFYVPALAGRTIVTDGEEMFEIAVEDLAEAQADGFRDALAGEHKLLNEARRQLGGERSDASDASEQSPSTRDQVLTADSTATGRSEELDTVGQSEMKLPPDDRRGTEDDYEDNAGDEEDRVGQRVDGPRDRALRRQSVQRSVSGATGQGGEPTDGEGGEPPRTQETAQGLGDQWSVSA